MAVDAIEFAKQLMRCASVTPHDEGALATLESAIEPMGFCCTRMPFSEEGEPDVDNLFAKLGTGKPYLAFAGHTDVVPPGRLEKWTNNPFEPWEEDGWLYGRGTEDMKGAIACFVSAVSQFLEERNNQFDGAIGLIITGDEEGFGVNGTRKMVTRLKEINEIPDGCIVGEPTNPEQIGDMVKIGRRGSMNMVLTVHGQQGHVAYPQLADNPVTTIVNICHALKQHVIDEGMDFFLPTNLEVTSIDVGNEAKNVIAEDATARINIRFNPLHHSSDMEKWMRGVIEKYVDKNKYDLEVRVTGEAFLTEPGPLSDLMTEAVKSVTGKAPELSTTGGTSDARWLKDLCPVAEFGTTGRRAHMINERVRIDDMHVLTKCYLEILRRFFA